MNRYDVRPISTQEMTAFVLKHHYSSVMPRITKACYGGFRDDDLVASISFGWGSRPRHTIQRLFPSLNTKDYLEIGKMCLRDDQPPSSESMFMSTAFWMVCKKFPEIKLIFTWADGIWGKPGYVYQASNFLYGGFIWTDVYQSRDGRRIHPLQLQSVMGSYLRGQRPNAIEMAERGWKHYFGKQFRYVKFVCDRVEKRRLLAESAAAGFTWTDTRAGYPKHQDLEWKVSQAGVKVICEQPVFTGTISAAPAAAGASNRHRESDCCTLDDINEPEAAVAAEVD